MFYYCKCGRVHGGASKKRSFTKVLEYINEKSEFTLESVVKATKIPNTTAGQVLLRLVRSKFLKVIGKRTNSYNQVVNVYDWVEQDV